MIRGSLVIAALAALLSLVLHLMGLSLTAPRLTQQPQDAGRGDSVELSNSFEDLVDTIAEPVEPEPPEAPEPVEEEPPEPAPEPAELPTTEVHVASDDPKQTYAPDTGTAEVLQPVAPEPVEAEAPETQDPADGDNTASDEVEETPSAEAAEVAEAPEGSPEATEPAEETPAAPEPTEAEQIAALPDPAESAVPSATPVVPAESDTVEADIPATPSEPVPDAEESSEEQQQAPTSSVRPRLPDRNALPEPPTTLRTARDFSDLQYPTQEVESPLTTYQRQGRDLFTSGSSGSRSGGRNPGNSDRTNYAGKVLVHLNRAPIVYTAARGFARVFFRINPDGTLAFVDVVDTNGSPDLERAAKAQVQAASPFPKPPGGVSRSLTFVYSSN
jgi:TonB family protein